MDQLNGLLVVFGVIGGAVSLLTAVVAGYVWVRRSGEIATIESQGRLLTSLERENADLTRRVESLERENVQLHRAVAQVQGIEHVQATVDAIKADTTAIRMRVAS